jgi:arginyl-tRNA synthetase
VAKAIWAILKSKEYLGSNLPKEVSRAATWIGECYSFGAEKYENDENAKREIDVINKKIYDRNDEKINKIYDWGRKITLEAFEEIYKTLGTKFDRYYFESQVASIGEKIVRENIGKFFEESDGAVVFHGEKYDPKLHTRVFINSQGLPTYETKELGLTLTKFKRGLFEKKLDFSVVTTAVEQAEYMKVAQKAISLIRPKLTDKIKHITHGMMRLASGKMSSRKGNIVTGESLLRDSMEVVLQKIKDREFTDAEKKKISEIVGVSALKYSILKSSIGSDIIYDFEKSISFEGDSGPYLQYTAVRANSVLNKAKNFAFSKSDLLIPTETTNLEKLLYQFPEIVERSYEEFAPHYIATYLTKLASAFNSFYGNTKILDKENKNIEYQLNLVKAFSQTMQNGLYLLGIQIPEKM